MEQLVASAEAAVEEVVKRGVTLFFYLCADINDFFYRMCLYPFVSDFYG